MFRHAISLLKWLLLGVAACLLMALAINTREKVTISLYPLPYALDMRLFYALMLSFIVGALTGGGALLRRQYRTWRLLMHAKHRIDALEQERAASQNLAVRSDSNTPKAA